MFEINGRYANRKGEYTVLAINPPKMTVRYDDGSEASLNIEIQERIWENMRSEHEPRRSQRTARRHRRPTQTGHFIKIVSLPDEDELLFPGWQEQVVLVGIGKDTGPDIKTGDRLIYYALETHQFLAVATVIGDPAEHEPGQYFYTLNAATATFVPVDIDAAALDPGDGIALESVELESQPTFGAHPPEAEAFVPINEDDFELLAELLAEISEEEEEEDEDNDDLAFDEEED